MWTLHEFRGNNEHYEFPDWEEADFQPDPTLVEVLVQTDTLIVCRPNPFYFEDCYLMIYSRASA